MKKLSVAAVALVAFGLTIQSWASVKSPSDSVTLDMKLEMNGKLVASPRMIMSFGKKGMISEQASDDPTSYSVEIEPNKEAGNLVALNIVVSQVEGGKSKVLFTSKVVGENGRPAEIIRKQAGLKDMRLVVTPTF